jgi:hypothetical protein
MDRTFAGGERSMRKGTSRPIRTDEDARNDFWRASEAFVRIVQDDEATVEQVKIARRRLLREAEGLQRRFKRRK